MNNTGAKKKQIPASGVRSPQNDPNLRKNESDEWLTQDDVERDMWIYSEFFQLPEFKAAPPKTILEWQNRKGENNAKSIFDEEIPEEREYIISGRGRGVPHTVVRPGEPVYATKKDTDEIKRKIREITGLGYRNQIIEQQFANRELSDIISDQEFVDSECLPQFVSHTSETNGEAVPVPPLSEILSLRSSSSNSSNSICSSEDRMKLTSPSKDEHLDISSAEEFPPLN